MSKPERDFSDAIVTAGIAVARDVSAHAVFVHAAAVEDLKALHQAIHNSTKLIAICRDDNDQQLAEEAGVVSLVVPSFDLTRMGQIKMATLIAFSQGLLKPGEAFVFLSGAAGRDLDTVVTMRVGEEYELFQSVGQPRLTEHIRRPVFERLLRIAMELAHEGREGKPVGAIFVVGDHREVLKFSMEGRINPFKGYTEKQRNILDETIGDTVKEVAKMDGAFILKGNGVIVSACAILKPVLAGAAMPQGLGARHASAAAITANTKSIAITLSESTGDVRVWRRGALITEIEKAPRALLDGAAPPVL